MTDFFDEENELTPEENDPQIVEDQNGISEVPEADGEKTKKERLVSDAYDFLEVMAMTISIVVLLFSFVLRFAGVSGNSMFDTYSSGDSVLMLDLGYTPQNGDVVVIHQTSSYFQEPLIKRVIATSGQTLNIDFGTWSVYVNGEKLNEDYVTRGNGTMDTENYYSIYADLLDEHGNMVIPDGYCFVMGDNRNHSSDSRFYGVGLVKNSEVVGRAILKFNARGGKN
ncbi:MAG: signal peptidase I [Clostridia bacterium]|nr:signal peptidase I [Clostridia bacterium]